MSDSTENLAHREMWLKYSKQWYEREPNPLHVWRALAVCLNATPKLPIPEWCLRYLAKAAINLTNMTGGEDFRDSTKKINPKQAHSLVSEALGFSKQGQKNAFAKNAENAKLAHLALEAERRQSAPNITLEQAKEHEKTVIKQIGDKRNVTSEHAQRLLAKGKAQITLK